MFKLSVLAQTTCDECMRVCRAGKGSTAECKEACRTLCKGISSKGVSNPVLSNSLTDLSGGEFLNKLISLGISVGFLVASVVFVYMFIMGGIRWITSEGDKNKVETARNQITHALVGLLLTFLLFVILGIIEQFFGISLKELSLPSLTD